MRGLLGRLLAIGADPGDDEDTRLRKVLLLVASITIAPLAVVWGAIYWIGGATLPALIPWAYAAISAIGLVVFSATRRYPFFAVSQFVPYMVLPFLLMWSLGGPVEGSVVAVWAGLAPIVALLLGHRRAALLLAGVYAVLIVVTVVVPGPADAPDPVLRDLFFVLNLAGVPLVAWLLVHVFAGGREGALSTARTIVRRYLPPELVSALGADPARLDLGGQVAEVTAMFADLGGYTTYAESRGPSEVVDLLNRYFAAALPAILEEGGTPIQLPGDAIFAVFGAPTALPDHAARAYRAASEILARTAHHNPWTDDHALIAATAASAIRAAPRSWRRASKSALAWSQLGLDEFVPTVTVPGFDCAPRPTMKAMSNGHRPRKPAPKATAGCTCLWSSVPRSTSRPLRVPWAAVCARIDSYGRARRPRYG